MRAIALRSAAQAVSSWGSYLWREWVGTKASFSLCKPGIRGTHKLPNKLHDVPEHGATLAGLLWLPRHSPHSRFVLDALHAG